MASDADERRSQASGIRETAVIGAGLMGHGIAQVFAENGCSVALYDMADALLAGAMEKKYAPISRCTWSSASKTANSLKPCCPKSGRHDLADAVRGAQYVTEAIPEDLNLKIDVFRKLDAATDDRVVLATNTSTLPITAIAGAIKKGDRVIITHWFNPPHLVPVVEVVKGESTSKETFGRLTFRFLKDMGKEPVHVLKQVPGFLVNRIQTAMFREVVALLEEKVASAEDIDKAVQGSFSCALLQWGPSPLSTGGSRSLVQGRAESLPLPRCVERAATTLDGNGREGRRRARPEGVFSTTGRGMVRRSSRPGTSSFSRC